MGDVVQYVSANWEQISVGIGALLVAAAAVAELTPNQTDDRIIGKLQKLYSKLTGRKKGL